MRDFKILRTGAWIGGLVLGTARSELPVRARSRRTSVTRVALQGGGWCGANIIGIEEGQSSDLGITSVEVGGVSAIKVLIGIRLEGDSVDEVAVGVDVGAGEGRTAQKARKRDVKNG